MNEKKSQEQHEQAGDWESMYIHLIANSFDDKIETLAEQWDEMPGLSEQQQLALRKVSFFRPQIERIAYIKRNLRISENSPTAAPMENFLLNSMKVLMANTPMSQESWISALGVGNFNIQVANGEMALEAPPALQKLGLPEKLTTSTPGVSLKLPSDYDGSALQPYLRVDILLGPFEIDLTGNEIVASGDDKGKIKATFSINQGSKLGEVTLAYKWDSKLPGKTGDEEKKLEINLSPELEEPLSGGLYFNIDEQGLSFDRVHFSGLKIKTDKPKMPVTLNVMRSTFETLSDTVTDEIEKMLSRLGFERLLETCLKNGSKALCSTLTEESIGQDGIVSVNNVKKLQVDESGTLSAEVEVTQYNGPTVDDSDIEILKKVHAKHDQAS